MSKKSAKSRKKQAIAKKTRYPSNEGYITMREADVMYDRVYGMKTYTKARIKNFNRLVSSLLDQYEGNEDSHKESTEYDLGYTLNKENMERLIREDYSLTQRGFMSGFTVHEEILWIFDGNYRIPNYGDFLKDSDSVKWNIGSDSHKSPDLIFIKDGKKIGVEVTRIKRPNLVKFKEGADINKIIQSLKDDVETSSFDKLRKTIEKKKVKIDSYEKCDEYILVVITNPIGGDKDERANKLMMQILAQDISEEDDIFAHIFVA